ncbi:uncharacterized protein si:rp71-1g18.1 isoform X2 [Clinocottus analis]|uniref:uncharacterized protein si:rp71-1g18.1 isoform X2 n=1 Tax=Clinocottus analis TaxID=304258 RepID=UPI0035C169B9
MSANLQAQVESVLGTLVKAASVELTKLFESRYRASAQDVVAGRAGDKEANATRDRPSPGDATRSIGVQVDEDICPPLEFSGQLVLSDGDCLSVEVVEGSLLPLETLLAEDEGQVDPKASPPKEQGVEETPDMMELNGFEAESPTDGDPPAEVVLQDSNSSVNSFRAAVGRNKKKKKKKKKRGCSMEDAEKTKLEELLMCPVCQDIFRDPRQLPCGHSLCMVCLENMMDHSSGGPFRCPDCRADFGPIIAVHKSYALANIVEDFRVNQRRREKQTKSVFCDFCPEKRTVAIKTCLKCEVSLCAEHVKDHLELPVFSGHPLVRPLGDLLERKCPQHEDEVLRYYCNSSSRYMCNICALESRRRKQDAEASSALRRQLMEYMDQRFNMIMEQIGESFQSVNKLQENLKREKRTGNPVVSSVNSVTVVLFCLWLIVLYYDVVSPRSPSTHQLTTTLWKSRCSQKRWRSSRTACITSIPPLWSSCPIIQ